MRRYVCSVENGRAVPLEIERILVPIDFSETSTAALTYAVDLAARTGAHVDALHVWELPPYPAMGKWRGDVVDEDTQAMPSFAQHVHALAAERLREMITDASREGVEVEGILESGEPVPVIARLAPRYDLVVIGAHDDEGAVGLLLGNVADRVAGEVACPVVSVRTEPTEETGEGAPRLRSSAHSGI